MSTNIWVVDCSDRTFLWLLAVHDFQRFSSWCMARENASISVVIGSWASCKNVRGDLVGLPNFCYFWSSNAIANPSKIELSRSRIFNNSRCWNMVRSKMVKWDRFRLSVRYYTLPLHSKQQRSGFLEVWNRNINFSELHNSQNYKDFHAS